MIWDGNMADPAKTETLETKPRKGRKLVIIGGGLILLIGAVIVSVILLAPGLLPQGVLGSKGPEGKEPSKETHGHIYTMEPFLVNLADTEQPRYLKVRIDVESDKQKVDEEYAKRLPQLRDAILTILSNKTYQEIFDSEGKKKLKDEIISKVNQLLSTFKVKSIYFTDFVVQ